MNPLEHVDKLERVAALVASLEPIVISNKNELLSVGSLVDIKKSVQELQKKANEAILKEDLKKVSDLCNSYRQSFKEINEDMMLMKSDVENQTKKFEKLMKAPSNEDFVLIRNRLD
jgi:hypothetical protein